MKSFEVSIEVVICSGGWRAVQGGTLVTFVQSAPAGHPGGLAHQVLVRVWHAHWDDVGLEGDGLVEPAEC